MYLVSILFKSREVILNIGNQKIEQELPMVFEEGMVGCCPVFGTFEAAKAFVGDSGIEIVQISEGLRW